MKHTELSYVSAMYHCCKEIFSWSIKTMRNNAYFCRSVGVALVTVESQHRQAWIMELFRRLPRDRLRGTDFRQVSFVIVIDVFELSNAYF